MTYRFPGRNLGRAAPDVLVGADPEFELLVDGEVVDAGTYFPEDHYWGSPVGLDGAKCQVELRPEPSVSAVDVASNISSLIAEFHRITWDGYDLSVEGDVYPLGGHIHIAWPSNQTREEYNDSYNGTEPTPGHEIIEAFDIVLGEPLQKYNGSARREEGYGFLSDYRTNYHGFEYRTPPSFPFAEPKITATVLNIAQQLAESLLRKKWVEIPKVVNIRGNVVATPDEFRGIGVSSYRAAEYLAFIAGHDIPNPSGICRNWLEDPQFKPKGHIVFQDEWDLDTQKVVRDLLAPKIPAGKTVTLFGLHADRGICTAGFTIPLDRGIYAPRIPESENPCGGFLTYGIPQAWRVGRGPILTDIWKTVVDIIAEEVKKVCA